VKQKSQQKKKSHPKYCDNQERVEVNIFCYISIFNSLLLRESNGGVIFWTNLHHLGVTVSSWFF